MNKRPPPPHLLEDLARVAYGTYWFSRMKSENFVPWKKLPKAGQVHWRAVVQGIMVEAMRQWDATPGSEPFVCTHVSIVEPPKEP